LRFRTQGMGSGGVVVICDPSFFRRPDHAVIGGRWSGPSVSDGGAGVPAGPDGVDPSGERSGGDGFTRPGSDVVHRALAVEPSVHSDPGRAAELGVGPALFRATPLVRPQAARLAVLGKVPRRRNARRHSEERSFTAELLTPRRTSARRCVPSGAARQMVSWRWWCS
jgi:hypothetical protein